jgi:hypothetical protein
MDQARLRPIGRTNNGSETIKYDALYALNQVADAANLLEISLANAKRILGRDDLPEPFDRSTLPLMQPMRAEADIGLGGSVGEHISIVIDTLEELADELEDE